MLGAMTKTLALATPTQSDVETGAAKLRELILQRIRDGESLRSICKDKAMPARSTVHLWLANVEGFSDHYARACEIRADVYADEILEIADDASRDWITKKNPDGSTYRVLDGEHVQRARLRIDSRKWLMSKMAPKKYGDRIELEGDPDAPIQHSVQIEFVKSGAT